MIDEVISYLPLHAQFSDKQRRKSFDNSMSFQAIQTIAVAQRWSR